MRLGKASRRYAAALYALAQERGCTDQTAADMADFERLIGASPDLAGFLGDYGIQREKRRTILVRLFEGCLHPLTWQFVLLLEGKRRLGLMGEAAVALREILDREAGLRAVTLISALPLDEGSHRLLSACIERRAGAPVRMKAGVAPSLLGGFTFQIEDVLCDFSVACALRVLRKKMIHG